MLLLTWYYFSRAESHLSHFQTPAIFEISDNIHLSFLDICIYILPSDNQLKEVSFSITFLKLRLSKYNF